MSSVPPADDVSSPAFAELARVSQRLSSTRSRLEKKGMLVAFLQAVSPAEVKAAVGWLAGEPICGPIGVGPAQLFTLSKTPAPSAPSTLLREVEAELQVARTEDHAAKFTRVQRLFASLTAPERAFFSGALTGSLRQGSLAGVMLLALAELAAHTEEETRRVVMLRGSIASAADALLGTEREHPPRATVVLFRAVAPMLAAPAETIESAATELAEMQVEWKIDGVRVQIHKLGPTVAIYSRQGNDITRGCRPLLPSFESLAADALVLDGEVALTGPDGAPRPFQESFSAIASKAGDEGGGHLRAYVFDCLHRDGEDLLDLPLAARAAVLRELVPAALLVPSSLVRSAEEASRFYRSALEAGHEGVVVKDPASPYRVGARGRAWRKVKEFTTVDLVILAAEWGHGRRRGWLSNLHLGARRDDGSFCMIGKTFKGLTDEMLSWQTSRLRGLAVEEREHVIYVRPELVVEIRFNDVQRSPRYPGGIALRFARVVRYRQDKAACEIESLASLAACLPAHEAAVDRVRGSRKGRGEKKRRQLSLFGD